MNKGFWSQAGFEFEEAIRNLKEKAYSALEQTKGPQISRVFVRTAPMDLLFFLRNEEFSPRFYWSDREGSFEIVGLGLADSIQGPKAFTTLRERLANLGPENEKLPVRYYGGSRFHPTFTDPATPWARFGEAQLVLPRFELINCRDGGYIVCNLSGEGDLEKDLTKLSHSSLYGPSPIAFPKALKRSDTPPFEQWKNNVDQCLQLFRDGELRKVVLARECAFEFESELDSALLFRRLKETTPGCFHFYYASEKTGAFLGASPERLYRRDGTKLWTEAVAGTRPRGKSKELDEELASELQSSPKDHHEHQWVKDWVMDRLEPHCAELKTVDQNQVLKLSRVQHLQTRFEGTLAQTGSPVPDDQLIESLHPTPAVGGFPRDAALNQISRLEQFDRGWYAGCLGWVARDSAEFTVGIRSALVQGRKIHLYSGAGIVEGSDPQKEWDELQHKISDFLKVLNLV